MPVANKWNRENKEKVKEAQRRWYEKERKRRANLTPFQKAKEKVYKTLRRLTVKERRDLLCDAADDLLPEEFGGRQ